jgi:tetratricopeptide (TPR) repeat protein
MRVISKPNAAFLLIFLAVLSSCASQRVTTAEEYFSLGMAYFELGQTSKEGANRTKYFAEAEKWLGRARSIDKTKSASEYNLGRIAFETGRYNDAAKYFQGILKRDSENVMALRAISYTFIKMGEIDKALNYYHKLQSLIPDSADDGYNYALVLYALEKYEEAENVLASYRFALLDNADVQILYARTQKEQNKVEAVDSYAKWLANNSDSKARYEYGQVLEYHEFYARALEEYRSALTDLAKDSKDPQKADLHFSIASLLLIADSETDDGIKELETAIKEGFSDIEKLENLLEDKRISANNKNSLNKIISDKKLTEQPVGETGESRPLEENIEVGADTADE